MTVPPDYWYRGIQPHGTVDRCMAFTKRSTGVTWNSVPCTPREASYICETSKAISKFTVYNLSTYKPYITLYIERDVS